MSTTVKQKLPFGSTWRNDKWWLSPILVFAGLTAFIIYTTWAALQGEHYWAISYLSPFYSPLLFIQEGVAGAAPIQHAWLGDWPSWWPSFLPASPAIFILAFPALFRFTCYYYRGAYYKAFAGSPPACAVGPIPQKKYLGETYLMLFQNLHRYALYFGIIFIFILAYDAIISYSYQGELGVGLGSIILTINPILLGLYTFGCHSFRHLIGGRHDCLSCSKARLATYKKVSWMNRNHKLFAWMSLFWVAFTDIYVRLVSNGVINDPNTWGV